MGQGLFVAIEGIDGAGTSTQAELLANELRREGRPVHLTREPSDGPIGSMIRQVLRGRLVAAGSSGRPLGWETMALLFAADRMDHLKSEIEPNLGDGIDVVTDRYYHSSIVYQAETSGEPATWSWIRTLNQRARAPNLTVILDVQEKVAQKRRAARRSAVEIFEEPELQARMAAFYRRLPELLAGEPFAVVDGNRGIDAVHELIVGAVQSARLRQGT
ncbi:MAG: dTMP kinase [Deltaproteobacteria bacterium]|nr:dTMP kinase [Deltaproteobacteria bacterium]